jgi:hypothetical protein
MTYKDNFVAEVKYNGKILRIKDDAVYLPFGSEYTLLLKNLNSRRASVKVLIDGHDVLDYGSLIIDGNSEVELEGFLSGVVAKNRFKFIKKTKEIQEHRGDKADDGLIRVEFAFEKPVFSKVYREDHHEHHHHHHHYDWYPWWPRWTYCSNNFTDASECRNDSVTYENKDFKVYNVSRGMSELASRGVEIQSLGIENLGKPLDDEGITVKGSECNQEFRYGSIGSLDPSEVIIIRLKGLAETGKEVEEPITVKTKLVCSTCGTKCKSSYKFCPNCGTFLE